MKMGELKAMVEKVEASQKHEDVCKAVDAIAMAFVEREITEDEQINLLIRIRKACEENARPTKLKDAIRIEKEADGFKGYAEVLWIEDDGYNVPHWSAFISVPFKDSKWEYIGSGSTKEACEKAEAHLAYALSCCTMI